MVTVRAKANRLSKPNPSSTAKTLTLRSRNRMAAYHHHCLSRNSPSAAACCCAHTCCCGGGSAHIPLPSQLAASDPLIQALSAHLLHAPHPPPQSSSSSAASVFYDHLSSYQRPQNHRNRRESSHDHHPQTVDSLLCRIDALEASLRQLSSSCSPLPPLSLSSPGFVYSHHRHSRSLRELAARTIQIHFRAFLVRRSRTLRQLKDLAFIKSSFNALKSSVSDSTRFDPESLSRKAMDMLGKLDSVQDGDPMIRSGRRSISVELFGFLEFLDEVLVKRHQISARSVKNTRFSQNGRKNGVFIEKLRGAGKEGLRFSSVCENGYEDSVEELLKFHPAVVNEQYPSVFGHGKLGFGHVRNKAFVRNMPGNLTGVKKCMSFADDVKLPRVLNAANQPFSNRDVCVEDGEELVRNHYKEEAEEESGSLSRWADEEEDDDEGNMENGGSAPDSNDDRNPGRTNLSTKRIGGHNQDDEFMFSAPLPLKMDSRTNLVNKRQLLKISDAIC